MKINDLYDTAHDKAFAENIQQKCVIINQLHQALIEKDAEIEKLQKRINATEDYVLKEKAMESILKLAAMSDMSNLAANDK